MASVCAGCNQKILNKGSMICVLCKSRYDLECANVSNVSFNTMNIENKKTWKCQTCRCKMPKVDNSNTPIRQQYPEPAQIIHTPSEISNITMRKKSSNTKSNTASSEDLSLLGDTIYIDDRETAPQTDIQTGLTLNNLNEIIIQRLKENNKLIIAEIKDTIQIEIKKAINQLREEVELKTNTLANQNAQIKEDIKQINLEIHNIQIENGRLKQEIKSLSTKTIPPGIYCNENNTKKIVLYGFTDYHKQPEYDLHSRLIELFHDTMNVNLTGYIEDVYRIGKKTNNNRPLVIELLSKRMAKYVINNGPCFQGTRLSISEFLDDNARKARQLLREEMIKARKKGLYAIIRNNNLFIEGKNINIQNETYEIQHNQYNNTTELKENEETNDNSNQSYQLEKRKNSINHSFRSSRPTV